MRGTPNILLEGLSQLLRLYGGGEDVHLTPWSSTEKDPIGHLRRQLAKLDVVAEVQFNSGTTGLPICRPDGKPYTTLMFPLQTFPLKHVARDKLSCRGLRGNARDPQTLQPIDCKRFGEMEFGAVGGYGARYVQLNVGVTNSDGRVLKVCRVHNILTSFCHICGSADSVVEVQATQAILQYFNLAAGCGMDVRLQVGS